MESSQSEPTGTLLGLSNDLAGAVARVGASVVAVNARHRQASSGIHWQQGVIITADHTVERDDDVTVTLPDGRTVAATIAGRDAGTDLTVLQVQGLELPAAPVAEVTPQVGHVVLAVARPGENGLSASLGVISSVGGAWRTHRGGQIDHLVRLDLTLYPGFSGGPLVDARGQVIGLLTSGLTRGMGVAIPVSTIQRVVSQLLSTGRIARGYLGVGMQSVILPEALTSKLNLARNSGLIVVSVQQGGPAEKAGLLLGDILVELEGRALSNTDDVQLLLDPERVGTTLTARIVRGGESHALTITVGERPHKEF